MLAKYLIHNLELYSKKTGIPLDKLKVICNNKKLSVHLNPSHNIVNIWTVEKYNKIRKINT